jgi:hypothetical protein
MREGDTPYPYPGVNVLTPAGCAPPSFLLAAYVCTLALTVGGSNQPSMFTSKHPHATGYVLLHPEMTGHSGIRQVRCDDEEIPTMMKEEYDNESQRRRRAE